ncbi:MAG: hypothetical protein FWG93_02845, partial [Oscillospiraceae bacterium]|nr:hypothetical protein [Oscillospiraceae bacterium]
PRNLTPPHQPGGWERTARAALAGALAAWLRPAALVGVPAAPALASDPLPDAAAARGYMGAAGTVGRMARLLDAKTPEDAGPVNLWPYVQRGNPAEHEMFTGTGGKRKAVISFLHKIQNAPRALDVFIMTGASGQWVREDETFAALWPRCLLALLQRGHRLHIVMPEAELGEALASWLAMPLFYTPRCRVYAIPSRMADTLVVAQGYAAVLSYGVGPKEEATFLFSGVLDSSTFEAVFHRWLKEGYPVLFTCEETARFAERLSALEARSGSYYQARNTLSALHLTEEELGGLLAGAGISDSACLERHRSRREAMDILLAGHEWVEVVPRRMIAAVRTDGVMPLDGAELGLARDLAVPRALLRGVLERLTARMRECPRLHVILPDTEPLPIQILYKERAGAYFSLAQRRAARGTAAREGQPAAAYLGDPDGLRALGEWFSSMNYDRGETIRQLKMEN